MQSMIGSGNMEPGQAVDVAGTCSMFCVSTKGIIPELSKKGAGLYLTVGPFQTLTSTGDISVPADLPCAGLKIISVKKQKTAATIRY